MSFRFQLAHGLAAKPQAGLRYFLEYWAGQAGLVSPLLFLALWWAMAKSGREGFRLQKDTLLLLFWTSLPILLFFACTSLRTKVEANWPGMAYFSATVALAGCLCAAWPTWKKGKKALVWAMGLTAFLCTALAHLQPLYALIPLPAAKDPTSQLQGWRSLGARLQEVARSPDPGQGVFLLTPRHQLVGEGMFYTQGRVAVYQWDAPQRLNHLSPVNAPP